MSDCEKVLSLQVWIFFQNSNKTNSNPALFTMTECKPRKSAELAVWYFSISLSFYRKLGNPDLAHMFQLWVIVKMCWSCIFDIFQNFQILIKKIMKFQQAVFFQLWVIVKKCWACRFGCFFQNLKKKQIST